jgi:signal transduction histidine kinase
LPERPWVEKPRGSLRDDAAVFRRARLQLTAWYALTLVVVMLVFSGIVYGIFTARLAHHHDERLERAGEQAAERRTASFALDELRLYLVVGNLALLLIGTGGAYLLAGRTLRPIAQAMERQRRFTSDASHEMRTPLTVMRGAIDVALQRQRSAADYRAVLQEVGDEVDGLTQLTERLLLLARGAGRRHEIVDVVRVVDEAVRANAPLADERGSTVLVEPGQPIALYTDATALRQALGNLIANALQHTPSGTMVRVRCTSTHDGVEIRVIDNGPGIPASERTNVFQPFYRLKTSDADGHGLGLALARELIAAAGGSLQLEETPAGGLTAVIRLAGASAATRHEPAAPA